MVCDAFDTRYDFFLGQEDEYCWRSQVWIEISFMEKYGHSNGCAEVWETALKR
jgi:hypothetical protein